MRLLLDTHILLWLTLTPELLPAHLRDRLAEPEGTLVVSAASAWEISIKYHLGKLPEGRPLIEDFTGVVDRLGADLLSITPAHAIRAGTLEWAHRDPFDRLLVAQALQDGFQLVTSDGHILGFAEAPVFS